SSKSFYQLEVQKFVPIVGDSLSKCWIKNGALMWCNIPPYAIVDLEKAAQARWQFLKENVLTYLRDSIKDADKLIWTTYQQAIRHATSEAKVRSNNDFKQQ